MSDKICELCGTPVKVVGNVTQRYEPIHAHDRSYIKALTTLTHLEQEVERQAKIILALERLTKENEVYKDALLRIEDGDRILRGNELAQVPYFTLFNQSKRHGLIAKEALAEGLKIRWGDDK